MKKNFSDLLQIDLIKAFAILSVLITHALPYDNISNIIRIFTTAQAVPVFFIVMGRNMGSSFERNKYENLNQIYTKEYFKRRFLRILVPFIIIFIFSIIIGLFFQKNLYSGFLTVLGYLPMTGPGNYFVSIVFQFIIIFPIIYIVYKYNSKLLLIITFLISFIFELIAANSLLFNTGSYLYAASIFRYIFTISLGLWILDNYNNSLRCFFKDHKMIIIGFTVSIMYLFMFAMFNFEIPFFNNFWGTNGIFFGCHIFVAAFYPLLIFIFLFRFLPSISKNKIVNFLKLVGKASYHIFLIQIIFFGVGNIFYILYPFNNMFFIGLLSIFITLAVNLTLGIVFYSIEKKGYFIEFLVENLCKIKIKLIKSLNFIKIFNF